MQKQKRRKKPPKRVLALPDREQTKFAALNTLTSKSSQRSYAHAIDEFVDWYCSEPRLALNQTVVLRYRIYLEERHLAPTTINLRLAAVRRVAYEAADSGLHSPNLLPAFAVSRAFDESAYVLATGLRSIQAEICYPSRSVTICEAKGTMPCWHFWSDAACDEESCLV